MRNARRTIPSDSRRKRSSNESAQGPSGGTRLSAATSPMAAFLAVMPLLTPSAKVWFPVQPGLHDARLGGGMIAKAGDDRPLDLGPHQREAHPEVALDHPERAGAGRLEGDGAGAGEAVSVVVGPDPERAAMGAAVQVRVLHPREPVGIDHPRH